MAKEYKVGEKVIIEEPCGNKTCKDCFCKIGNTQDCDTYLLQEYGIPDCVFDRPTGEEVIYIEKPKP